MFATNWVNHEKYQSEHYCLIRSILASRRLWTTGSKSIGAGPFKEFICQRGDSKKIRIFRTLNPLPAVMLIKYNTDLEKDCFESFSCMLWYDHGKLVDQTNQTFVNRMPEHMIDMTETTVRTLNYTLLASCTTFGISCVVEMYPTDVTLLSKAIPTFERFCKKCWLCYDCFYKIMDCDCSCFWQ